MAPAWDARGQIHFRPSTKKTAIKPRGFIDMTTHAHNSQKVKSSPEEALKEILSECIAEFDQLRLDVNRQTRRAMDAAYRKGRRVLDKGGLPADLDTEWWRTAFVKAAIIHP